MVKKKSRYEPPRVKEDNQKLVYHSINIEDFVESYLFSLGRLRKMEVKDLVELGDLVKHELIWFYNEYIEVLGDGCVRKIEYPANLFMRSLGLLLAVFDLIAIKMELNYT